MQKTIKVLIASFVIAGCALALCFIFGPTIFSHEVVAKNIGGNIGAIFIGITVLVYPIVYRKLN